MKLYLIKTDNKGYTSKALVAANTLIEAANRLQQFDEKHGFIDDRIIYAEEIERTEANYEEPTILFC